MVYGPFHINESLVLYFKIFPEEPKATSCVGKIKRATYFVNQAFQK